MVKIASNVMWIVWNVKYPYFRELFKAKVNNSPFLVTFFKESLNKKTDNCELDLYVCYWDVNNKRAQKKFWASSLTGHSTLKDNIRKL